MSTLGGQPQYMDALARANEVRLARPALKREILDGSLSIADALDDPRAASMTVYQLLSAQRQWGRLRASSVLRGLRIGETQYVGKLTLRRRRVLAEACEPARRAA